MKSKKQSPKKKTGEKALILTYFIGERTQKKTALWFEMRYSQQITVMSEGDFLSNKDLKWTSSEGRCEEKFFEALCLRLGSLTLQVVNAEIERKLSRKKTIRDMNIQEDPFNGKPFITVEKISTRPRLKEKGNLITALVKVQYEYFTTPVPRPRKK